MTHEQAEAIVKAWCAVKAADDTLEAALKSVSPGTTYFRYQPREAAEAAAYLAGYKGAEAAKGASQ